MGLVIARRQPNDIRTIMLADMFVSAIGAREENDFGFFFSFFSMRIERKLGRRIVEIVVFW